MQFANLLEKQTSKKNIFLNPGNFFLPLSKDETTPLKLHVQLTHKQNENQYYKHTLKFSLVVFCCFTAALISSLIIEINKQQTAKKREHQFCWFIFIFYKERRQTTSLSLKTSVNSFNTPFAVHYEKIRHHLCETATNSAKIHSLARKSEHLCINQIQ